MCEQDYSPSAELISLILNWLEAKLIRNRTLISLVNCGRKRHTEIVPGLPRSLINGLTSGWFELIIGIVYVRQRAYKS